MDHLMVRTPIVNLMSKSTQTRKTRSYLRGYGLVYFNPHQFYNGKAELNTSITFIIFIANPYLAGKSQLSIVTIHVPIGHASEVFLQMLMLLAACIN